MDISNFNNNNQSTNTAVVTSTIGQILPNTVGLDTVRALHQTVVSLRAALENSQVELSRLRDKIKHRAEYRDAIEKLSIENHILRRKIIQNEDSSNEQICMAGTNELTSPNLNKNATTPSEDIPTPRRPELNSIPTIELPDTDKSEKSLEFQQSNQSKSNLSIERDLENLSLKSYSEGDNSVFSDNENVAPPKNDSENESEEVDDIELIFTTEETKELGPLQEDLVSITEPEQSKESDTDTPILVNYKTADFDSGDINGGGTAENSDDDVFVTDNKDNLDVLGPRGPGSDISKQRSIESQDSFIDRSFEKDESFDQFDEKEKKLQKMWSQCSVLVETDISKCGVLDDSEMPNLASRRNTCPNPLAYRPVIYRDNFMKATIQPTPASTSGARKYYRTRNSFQSSSIRPILNEKSALKTESEAQTDISALPCPWKSESYLAHKVAHNFTTLPSKFALPIYQQPKIRLSEKTQEARRVLLSDINFTSMVPELSRSADHLCQEEIENIPPSTYHTRGQYLRTPEAHRKYDTSDILTSPNFGKYYSPSDYSNFGSSRFDSSMHGMNRYRGSLTSITSPSQYDIGRHNNYWRSNVPQSFDGSSRARFSYSSRPTFGSVPTSPTRHHRSRSVPHVQRSIDSTSSRYSFGRSYSRPTSQWGFGQRNKTRSRVTFEDTNLRCNSRTNHSLPDLRSDSYDSGGDSTDSLVEEAEHFLRRSIDCMVSGGPMGHTCEDWKTERSRVRRASAPDPVRETDPPAGATPYLPRIPRDLRLGHWVKVIGPEGRVRGGRVRHVGILIDDSSSINTAYIGVELATPTGNSDGSYQGKRFFDCEPDHAIFVPFKKVIMAWNT
ncbi:uncharacterized protein LOC123299626 [Chrysoperla carnea]|uniref:uncharacterized protein LOC123299626 n=1 Tax=Chrysoperla carnea TaxID=189513 RepID=UPI001D08C071|nr:uncharacterized protein LOC123299626 [Chrysoperla carnea]